MVASLPGDEQAELADADGAVLPSLIEDLANLVSDAVQTSERGWHSTGVRECNNASLPGTTARRGWVERADEAYIRAPGACLPRLGLEIVAELSGHPSGSQPDNGNASVYPSLLRSAFRERAAKACHRHRFALRLNKLAMTKAACHPVKPLSKAGAAEMDREAKATGAWCQPRAGRRPLRGWDHHSPLTFRNRSRDCCTNAVRRALRASQNGRAPRHRQRRSAGPIASGCPRT
jgi:hypothetical protein